MGVAHGVTVEREVTVVVLLEVAIVEVTLVEVVTVLVSVEE